MQFDLRIHFYQIAIPISYTSDPVCSNADELKRVHVDISAAHALASEGALHVSELAHSAGKQP